MPSLTKAYVLSLNMGRNPTLLSCSHYDRSVIGKGGEFGGSCICIRGEVVGGSEPQSVTIVVENTPPQQLWKPLTLSRMEKARWHCSCSDFRFTFHPYIDISGDALYPFPPYEPNGRGSPRAIDGYGVCKHVMAVVNQLVKDRVFSPFETKV